MDPQAVRQLCAAILRDIAPEADLALVGDNEDLREALDLDSMDFLNFMIALGKRTARRIPDSDAPKLRTLSGLVAYFGPPVG